MFPTSTWPNPRGHLPAGVFALVCLLAVVLPFLLFVTPAAASEGEVIIVDKHDSTEYDTIQEAVDAASDGDTIRVKEGTYTQPTFIGTCEECLAPEKEVFEAYANTEAKRLTIEAAPGEMVVIDADDATANGHTIQSTGFYIADNRNKEVTIRGFTFENNHFPIQVLSAATVTAEDNAFLDSNTVDVRLRDHVVSAVGRLDRDVEFEDDGNYWGSNRNINPANFDENDNLDAEFSDPLSERPATKRKVEGLLTVNEELGSDTDLTTPYATLDGALHDAAPGAEIRVEDGSYDSLIVEPDTADDLTIRAAEGATPSIAAISVQQKENITVRGFEVEGNLATDGRFTFVDASENYWGQSDGPTDRQLRDASSAQVEPYCLDVDCTSLSDEVTDTSEYCFSVIGDAENLDTCSSITNPDNEVVVEYEYAAPEETGGELTQLVTITHEATSTDSAMVSLSLRPTTRNSAETVDIAPGETITRTLEAWVPPGRSGEVATAMDFHARAGDSETVRRIDFDSVYIDPADARDGDTPERRTGTGTVADDEVTRVLDPVNSSVSRFNDGSGTTEVLEDNMLPPLRYDADGSRSGEPQGTITGFSHVRNDDFKGGFLRADDGNLDVGFAVHSLPEGNEQELHMNYALQTEAEDRFVAVRMVDARGNPIDTSIPPEIRQERRLTQTVADGVDFSTNQQYIDATERDTVETNQRTFQLTPEEIRYVNEHGSMYFTLTSLEPQGDLEGIGGGGDNTLILFHAVAVTSDDGSDLPDDEPDEDEPWENDGEVDSATFETSYTALGQTHEEYGTIDIEPGEDLRVHVTITNNGDTVVERDIGLYEEWDAPHLNTVSRPAGGSPLAAFGDSTDGEIVERRTVRVEPGDSKTVPLDYAWPEHEYGNHTVTVLDVTEEEAVEIERETTADSETDVYVYQPATLEIEEVDTPDHHLVYDNFQVDVTVKNVGDLAGPEYVEAAYGNWEGYLRPNIPGGVARDGLAERRTLTFSRSARTGGESIPEFWERDYTPPDEYPSDFESEVSYDKDTLTTFRRANSPFGEDIGEHQFRAWTANTFAHPTESGTDSEELYDYLTDSATDETELYEFEIMELNIAAVNDEGETEYTLRPTATWSASAYPYLEAHPTDSGSSTPMTDLPGRDGSFNVSSNALRRCAGAEPFLPLTGEDYCDGVTNVQLPVEIDDDWQTHRMTARVRVTNPHDAQTGTARVAIVSNKSYSVDGHPVGLGESDVEPQAGIGEPAYTDRPNVVGVASKQLGPKESAWLHVPVVIRNDEGNDGVHVLRAVPRHELDYITMGDGHDPEELPQSLLTGDYHEQQEVPVEIDTFGDVLFDQLGPSENMDAHDYDSSTYTADYNVNEVCTGTGNEDEEGYNPTSGGTAAPSGEVGDCVADSETGHWLAQFTNYGGETLDHDIHARYDHVGSINENVDGESAGSRWYSNEEAWFDPDPPENTFVADETFQYNLYKDYLEPGIYEVKVGPTRVHNAEETADYTDLTYAGTNFGNTAHVKILDITEPVADFSVTRTWFDTKSGYQDHSAGTGEYEVWEGGTMKFDGREEQGYSADNVHIKQYSWTVGGDNPNFAPKQCPDSAEGCYSQTFDGSSTDGYIYHRFDSTDDPTLALTTWDDSRLTDGGANSNTTTQTITVHPDNSPPSVDISDDSSAPTWRSDSNTGYDGTEVCFSIDSLDDNAIGIEADRWDGIDGTGTDSPCRTWSTANDNRIDGGYTEDYTIDYNVWDFAGNHNSDDTTVTVYSDTDDPTVDLTNDADGTVWRSDSDTGYSGTEVEFTADATEEGPYGGVGFVTCPYDWSGDYSWYASSCSSTTSGTWSETGDKTVTVEVTDKHNNDASDSSKVTVEEEDSFTVQVSGDTDLEPGETGSWSVRDSPDVGVYERSWGGDVASDDGSSTSHSWDSPGTYTVKVTTTNNHNFDESASMSVEVSCPDGTSWDGSECVDDSTSS